MFPVYCKFLIIEPFHQNNEERVNTGLQKKVWVILCTNWGVGHS